MYSVSRYEILHTAKAGPGDNWPVLNKSGSSLQPANVNCVEYIKLMISVIGRTRCMSCMNAVLQFVKYSLSLLTGIFVDVQCYQAVAKFHLAVQDSKITSINTFMRHDFCRTGSF